MAPPYVITGLILHRCRRSWARERKVLAAYVTMMVADALAPNKRQAMCNHAGLVVIRMQPVHRLITDKERVWGRSEGQKPVGFYVIDGFVFWWC